MRTLVLTLSYDGTNYSGWQVQPDRPSLQQTLEQAICDLTGEQVKVAASGRTDAGVHAIGQIVSFQTQLQVPPEGYRWGLGARLPPDMVVTEVRELPWGFHARFDAVHKTYRYVIHNARTPTPWLRNYVWWQRSPLDLPAMQAATVCLQGTHDFRCFESQWPNRQSSVRTILAAQWSIQPRWQPWSAGAVPQSPAESTEDGERFLCFDIAADGFLYNMVRSIVGTLVHIGRGRWTADEMSQILQAGDRRRAGDTAPAQGLYLVSVETVVDLERIAQRRLRLAQFHADAEGGESEGE